MNKLTVLWLDDIRNPYKYFRKKSNSNTFIRNKGYYDNLMKDFDVDFVWVKNFDEFVDYILKNGIPQFISFDHDLGAKMKKGFDCAKWLVNYCNETGQLLPKTYVHSANPNGQREIRGILNSMQESTFNFNNIVKKTLKDVFNSTKTIHG